MNCADLPFSDDLRQQRLPKAEEHLGAQSVRKLLAYALFLLGVNRAAVSSFLDMPAGTVRSLVRAINDRGLAALEDGRTKVSAFRPPRPNEPTPTVEAKLHGLAVNLGIGDAALEIPDANPMQQRVVLLTFLNSGILSRAEVANALRLSPDRVGKLARRLREDDVQGVIDQRRGQQQDYRFTPEVKAELIQQFVIDSVVDGRTSGEQLAKHLRERCGLALSPRSITHHCSTLGLSLIKASLPAHLADEKKGSSAR